MNGKMQRTDGTGRVARAGAGRGGAAGSRPTCRRRRRRRAGSRGRLPDGWFAGAPEVTVDREEIVIVGSCPPLEGEFADGRRARRPGRGRGGPDLPVPRDHPRRADRDRPAGRAPLRPQGRVGRAARRAPSELFTVVSVPVMTRLRQPERIVLDTLVDAGVARSRSDALAWAVRLVGQHADDWLASCGRRWPRSTTCGPRARPARAPDGRLLAREQHQPDRDVVADRGQHRGGVEELVVAERAAATGSGRRSA